MYRWVLSFSLMLCAACAQPDAPAEDKPPATTAPVVDESAAYLNTRTDVSFVGDAACFDCHEDLYRSYQSHGMAQSFYPLTTENAVEDFSGVPHYHEATRMYYRAIRRDGRFYQEEYRQGADGRRTHELVREMDYVVGSGSAARTYLTEQDGRLYELPLTWYTQAGRWDFSPGYAEQNSRFDRLISDRCMACHNSYPESVAHVEGKYKSVPHGIGCERCHGPGSLHVEARLANPEAAQEIDYTIVNPRHLSLERRLDVCQQCHLHGTVSVLREGEGAFDFRPSELLSAHESLFSIDAPASDQISVISHADRMKQSACFIDTQSQPNAMDCLTCHNPHEGFRNKGAGYFNTTCLDCHAPADLQARFLTAAAKRTHAAEANCITCHMPKVEADDAPHASFTDHWIRVVEEEAAIAQPVAAHEAVNLVPFFEEDKQGHQAPIYEGLAYVIYGLQNGDASALEKGVGLLSQALEADPDHGEAQFLLGLAQKRMGQVKAAIPALEAAVRLDPGIPERLNALAQAYEATGRDPARIAGLYKRALSLQPALAEVRANYGRFLETQGRIDAAIGQYELAADEQPWLDVAHYNLGTAYLRRGDLQKAETTLQQALKLNPDHVEALGNLGLLYASQGALNKAKAQFEHAVVVAPNHPVALGNLGVFYLNEEKLPRAIDLLKRAVEADATYADGFANLALAYFRDDRLEEAERYARRAAEVNPSHPLARQILEAL